MTRIVYADDSEPGITRKKMRHGWGYWDADGNRIKDRDEIDRLNGVGLPPAYIDAWYSANPNGHLQAVGWDDKGRKQYRYHEDFRAEREDGQKYERCVEFGQQASKADRGHASKRTSRPTRALDRERTIWPRS